MLAFSWHRKTGAPILRSCYESTTLRLGAAKSKGQEKTDTHKRGFDYVSQKTESLR